MAIKEAAHVCCPGIVMLDSYLRFRAHLEGVPYELTPEFLQIPFDLGMRGFFGVRVSKKGIVRDYHNPEALAAWRGRH
jgi:hypothetical protein